MNSFKCIIIICCLGFYLNGQNKSAEHYFYNKAVDLILENSTFSVNNAKIFIFNKQVSIKPFLDNFKDRIPKDLVLDTTKIIVMNPDQHFISQFHLTVLDESFKKVINFENYFLSKFNSKMLLELT